MYIEILDCSPVSPPGHDTGGWPPLLPHWQPSLWVEAPARFPQAGPRATAPGPVSPCFSENESPLQQPSRPQLLPNTKVVLLVFPQHCPASQHFFPCIFLPPYLSERPKLIG